MSDQLHELILKSAARTPGAIAVTHKGAELSYEALAAQIGRVANGLLALGIARLDRVAIYLPKTLENVSAMFGATSAGGVFVPVNPLLKPPQVAHILRDCNVRVLITSEARARELLPVLQ